MSRGWVAFGALLTPAAVAVTAAGLWSGLTRADEWRTAAHAWPYGALTVVLDGGDLDLEPGRAGAVTVARDLSWTVSRPHPADAATAGTLRLGTRCPGVLSAACRVSYVVSVPPGMPVRVTAHGGDVTASGLTGALTVDGGAGEVTIGAAGGAVSATTREGQVTVTGTASGVRAASGAGDVFVLLTGTAPRSVSARSGAGDVHVRVPRGTAYHVVTGTREGTSRATVPDTPGSPYGVTATAGSGDARVDYTG